MTPKGQGNFGEMAAAAWMLQRGWVVFFPFPQHADVDLVVDRGGQLARVQVKTSTRRQGGRWNAQLCTRGGNQSWNGIVKYLDASRFDFLFVLVGDGRQWFIPAESLGGTANVILGGPKYERFEVERGPAIPPELSAKTLSKIV